MPFLKDDATTGSGAGGGVFLLLVYVRRLRREVTLDYYFWRVFDWVIVPLRGEKDGWKRRKRMV